MNERATAAVARIEQALAKISILGLNVNADSQAAIALAELEMRHQALKRDTSAALAEIDVLINQVRES
jgi:t-SNARE complex subunit (syntaxin)